MRVYEGSARLSAVFKRVYEAYESYLSQPSLLMGDRQVARMTCARVCEGVCGICVVVRGMCEDGSTRWGGLVFKAHRLCITQL